MPACGSARDDDVGGHHWTHLRREGSAGSEGGGIALRAMNFIMPPSAVTSTSSIIIRITTVHPFATSWPSSPKGDARTLRDLPFCVIWHDTHSGDWFAALASPYPASPDFPLFRGQNKTPRDNLLINPPLEMTVAADTPIVISTEAKRSGEISSSDGTGGITVGDLSTQSIMGAVPVCLP